MRKRGVTGVSLGICLQEPVSNRQKLLKLRVSVVNVSG